MRGIRDFSYGDYLVEPDYHRGFALLEKYNLVSSMPVEWQHMEQLRALANKFPNIMIVVDHTAFPTERTDEYFENWKKGVAIAATCDNIRWKISGLGMADHNWTIDSIRPYVLTSIETMGVERCFFATNWPVDWLFSTYDEVIDAYTKPGPTLPGLQQGLCDPARRHGKARRLFSCQPGVSKLIHPDF